MGYEAESHGWNISLYVKGATVAANFPNFANKLPETKIPQRIVKVLTSSPILAVFLRLPFCLWYSLYHSVISRERNISRWTPDRNKWTKIKLQNENYTGQLYYRSVCKPTSFVTRRGYISAAVGRSSERHNVGEYFRGTEKKRGGQFSPAASNPPTYSRIMKAATSTRE